MLGLLESLEVFDPKVECSKLKEVDRCKRVAVAYRDFRVSAVDCHYVLYGCQLRQ